MEFTVQKSISNFLKRLVEIGEPYGSTILFIKGGRRTDLDYATYKGKPESLIIVVNL